MRRSKTRSTLRKLEGDETRPHRPGSGAANAAVRTDDAMRRHEEIEGARRHRRRNAAVRAGAPDGARDVGV